MIRRKTKIRLIWAMALTGTALIAFAAWYVSQEFRFREYQSPSGKFSIQYPHSWTMRENTGMANVIFFSPKANDLDYFRENVTVVVQNMGPAQKSIEEYAAEAIKQMEAVFEEQLITEKSGPITVDGGKGYEYVFRTKNEQVDLKYRSVWTVRGATAYQITYTAFASQYNRYLAKAMLMVRSFRVR